MQPDDSTEAFLCEQVRAVAAGREEALRELYAALEGKVYGLALRLLGDAGRAEEATVETFSRVWERASTYDAARGRVAGWVCVMTRSLCLDVLRASRREPASLELEAAASMPDGADGPELELTATERAARVRSALGALPAEMQGALRAAFFDGLTYREVADRLGQPLGTVKTRIRSALVRLRAHLSPGEEEWA